MSSTFECPVIKIELHPHPNADTLSLVKIQGYQVVVKTNEWKNGDLAAYIPPDSVVPDREEFKFLDGKFRIKTRRFRGEWSHGLLMPVLGQMAVGSNAAEAFGVIPYESPHSRREGMSARERRSLPWYRRIYAYWREARERPRGRFPYYDIENFRKFDQLFYPGEPIIVTEKVHGANALYTSRKPWYSNNTKIFMRSRTLWKHPGRSDWWQTAFKNTPELKDLLLDFPGISVYGEVYGRGVQELEYGRTEPHFVGFDIWSQEVGWVNQQEALHEFWRYDIPAVPILFQGEYINSEHLYKLIEENKYSRVANGKQISEGLVVQSLETRKILKLISDEYLQGVK